ncbi:Mitochondrial NAD+ transporter [Komagataella phaffii CBS 7435]|uniref:Mitochondrial NAD+ transporter, involved in the transport of NAD+ into the mitochondria n=2 Tax=Komagataella phaffii TaxID=460519 RepID=C4R0L7_KOMPG|nr:Mitochondrial NAD+ transporter, involved in the transport of NAD+ into the mitochondria [Komagataella phaffii GS115]AOA62266.1 GQ67_00461T0 [Komagataella phaffii]CAH2448440.1 Mitochondrial NAD+ transporter [Komagataella phaffii CBS 7435]AOA68090.1 GQ68_00928T0 [Komagataella phaffii GS115]CAY69041.1 Mitochondrial NAD+ transporter, involved in the transport of NAD+ into the mitochondria [Komagataella phaffii GS115]CCA38561.1 Mitochondrial NAD+ transporter [Komagataella phaffii CBS 7435]
MKLKGGDGAQNPSQPTAGPRYSFITKENVTPISGALAGLIAGIAVCPLDVAKTRLQAQGAFLQSKNVDHKLHQVFENKRYQGLVQTIKTITREEGIRGLYRGLVPISIGYLPTWMIYFTMYETCQKFLDRTSFISQGNNLSYFISAIGAGLASSTLTNPIWVVKTRLMLQTGSGSTIYDRFDGKHGINDMIEDKLKHSYYKGTIDAFRKMFKEEGILSFYSGLLPSYFGLIHVAIHFPLYENFKIIFNCTQKDINEARKNNVNGSLPKSIVFKLAFVSCASKMFASAITYPHEILRTRLQIDGHDLGRKKSGLIKTIKSIYLKEGIRGFYSGFVINLTRTLPSSAVTLVSFEYIKNYLDKIASPAL